MADTGRTLSLADGQTVWDLLAVRLEALAAAWEAGGEPDLAAFVPPGPTEMRRLVLTELVKLDLEYRFQRGQPKPLADYLAAFPAELAAGGPPCDLLYEDYHLRKRAGEAVGASDYCRRYPEQAEELARLLGVDESGRSTSVHQTQPPADVQVGDRLDDFDLLAELGRGQFARVFLAWQRSMHRQVALKVSADRGSEAQTLAQLDHPHIVRVIDQRSLPGRGVRLVYMPYLPGGTLHGVIARLRAEPPERRSGRTLLRAIDGVLAGRGEKPPDGSAVRQRLAGMTWPAAVCWLGARLAEALDCAHRQGVLHRDVKPANVLLTAEGEPMLADFNVGCCSKLEGAGPAAFFGGSLAYMSPEHLEAFNPHHPRQADSLDGRSDLYGLAVTLWELLTGERPFADETLRGDWTGSLAALVERRRAGVDPAALTRLPEDGVRGLREALAACLAPDPANRPATGADLARALDLCRRPVTHALLYPPADGWRAWALRHPLLAMYPAGLLPNILASLFSEYYNLAEVQKSWKAAEPHFADVTNWIKAVFFPLGMLLFGLVFWPVARGLRRLREGRLTVPEAARLRRASLQLGLRAVWVCLTCWVVASVVCPAVLRILAGRPPQPLAVYAQFFVSLMLCGLVVAAYPYFVVTFLAARVLVPAFLRAGGPVPGDAAALRQAVRPLGIARWLSAAVPLLAIGLLAVIEVPNQLLALKALSLAGLAGCAVAYLLDGRIRADLDALGKLTRPIEPPPETTHSEIR
jgi:serine/threonine protein kinase